MTVKQNSLLASSKYSIESENRIFILLPVFNRKNITEQFIKCLNYQTYQNYHLILIDDNSTDGTEEMVQSYIESLTVIKGSGNLWWAGSLQKGYEWLSAQEISSSDIVLMINDDTQFEEDFLEEGVKIMKNSTGSMMLAQCYSNATGQLLDRGVSINWRKFTFEQAQTQEDINCFSTNGLMMIYNDFMATGGFYPKFLPHYTSDYEYTIRAIRRGIKPIISSDFKLCLNEKTTGHHKIESNEYQSKSFIHFIRDYFSLKSPPNPIYLSSFVFLACPWRWKIKNIVRIWKRSIFVIIKVIMN